MRTRRRSWVKSSSSANRNQLVTMVAMFVTILVLLPLANRPATWRALFPAEESSATSGTPVGTPETSAGQTVPRPMERNSPVLMGALIVAAVAYLAWRGTTLVRGLGKASRTDRPNDGRPAGRNPDSA